MTERTFYSEIYPGTVNNYKHFVRFDRTSGYIGITQFAEGTNDVVDRVLLSPEQVKALLKFLGASR